MSDLSEMFERLQGCCLHNPQWLPQDVAQEIAWAGDRATGGDTSSIVLVALKDGRGYGLLTQSEDYTGHGCQCDSMTLREPTLRLLLGHLSDEELARLLRGDRGAS